MQLHMGTALGSKVGGGPGVHSRTGSSAAAMAGLAVCLTVLSYHIAVYRFLTDDAFISFRYARNLADGYGLVFNPGFERVEGYTNLLWVLILAGLDRALGWAPHTTANGLSIGAGVILWALVVAFCWRRGPAGASRWLAVVPALWLAVNRSFAVWCTSGLETKFFELLIVAATLLSLRHMERERSSWWGAVILLTLAALTRPDGLLLAGSLFAARAAYEWGHGYFRLGATARAVALFVAAVAVHFLWRFSYYGDWLPNTYYVKLGGRSWWDMGALYWRTFLLEYGAPVWLLLASIGVVHWVRRRRGAAAWLIPAMIIPHAVYVAYCGGDHFEYRPIDLYFPLLAILLYDGVAAIAAGWKRPALAAIWGGLCCALVLVIPVLTHWDFPDDYRPGFPGGEGRADGNQELIVLAWHTRVAAVPGAAAYIAWYNDGFRNLSEHFVGLRAEEHRLFLSTVEPEGKRLAHMISAGILPRDTFIAIPCVGAIPYFSDLRTLDVLGLTDRHVARQRAPAAGERMMAHDKAASVDYLVERGVDVIAPYVHLLTHDAAVLADLRDDARDMGPLFFPLYISPPLEDGQQFIGVIKKPPAAVQARFPALHLTPAWIQ